MARKAWHYQQTVLPVGPLPPTGINLPPVTPSAGWAAVADAAARRRLGIADASFDVAGAVAAEFVPQLGWGPMLDQRQALRAKRQDAAFDVGPHTSASTPTTSSFGWGPVLDPAKKQKMYIVDSSFDAPWNLGGGFQPPSNLPTQARVFSTSGSAVTTPELRMAHVFGPNDVPAGSVLTVTANGQSVPYTAARRNLYASGALRSIDLLMKLPVNVPDLAPLYLRFGKATGTWSALDVLPGSATVASVVADMVANHDNLTVNLSSVKTSSGSVVGVAGNLTADLHTAQGLTAPHGGFRCVAIGKTAADFVFYMMMRDPNNSNAENASLWVQFYVTLWLNTSTGAVTFVETRVHVRQGLASVANDRFQYQASVTLGSTVVRTFGASTDEGGTRAPSFASTAVNTTTSQITVTGHGFHSGDAVLMTGTVPTATDPNNGGAAFNLATTLSYVRVVDPNTIQLGSSPDFPGGASPLNLTSQGSGTLALVYSIQHLYAGRTPLVRLDGLWDRWTGTGNSSFGTRPPLRFEHNLIFMRNTGQTLYMDNSAPVLPTTEASPTTFSPATIGPMVWGLSAPGSSPHIGPYTEWASRSMAARYDWNGYVKTARCMALMMGTMPIYFILDKTNFRVPAVNNGHANSGVGYAGLGSPNPTAWYEDSTDFAAPFVAQGGGLSAFQATTTNLDPSHWPHATHGLYIFEGGQDILDQMIEEANWHYIFHNPGFRKSTLSTGTIVYDCFIQNQTRNTPWVMLCFAYAAACAANDTTNPLDATYHVTAEAQYMADGINDSYAAVMDTINASGFPSYINAGVWVGFTSESTIEGCRGFMQAFVAIGAVLADSIWQSNNSQAFATFSAQFVRHITLDASLPAVWLGVYMFAVRLAPHANSFSSDYFGASGIGVWPGGFINFGSDGTTCTFTQPFNLNLNDQIWITDTDINGVNPGAGPVPSAGIAKYTKYFVRQTSGSPVTTFKLSTTASDAGILTGITQTNNVNFFYGAFGSSLNPGHFAQHNKDVANSWEQGYNVLWMCAATMMAKRGYIPAAAALNVTNLFALETVIGSSAVTIHNNFAVTQDPYYVQVNGITPGNWLSINTNTFQSVWSPESANLIAPSSTTQDAIISKWSGGSIDSDRVDFYIFGGGHAGYAGNDMYRWRSSTMKWERCTQPSQVVLITGGTFESVDGPEHSPIATHTYGVLAFLRAAQRFISFGGAAFNTGGPYINHAGARNGPYFFDVTQLIPPWQGGNGNFGNSVGGSANSDPAGTAPGYNAWQDRNNITSGNNVVPNGNSDEAFETGVDAVYFYFPGNGGAGSLGLYKLTVPSPSNAGADVYTPMGNDFNSLGAGEPFAGALDSINKIWIAIFTSSGTISFFSLSGTLGSGNHNTVVTPVDTTGGSFPGTANGLFACRFDPLRQRFVLWFASGAIWYLYSPLQPTPSPLPSGWSAGSWNLVPAAAPVGTTPQPSQAGNSNGIWGRFRYDWQNDVMLGVIDPTNGTMWAYRMLNDTPG